MEPLRISTSWASNGWRTLGFITKHPRLEEVMCCQFCKSFAGIKNYVGMSKIGLFSVKIGLINDSKRTAVVIEKCWRLKILLSWANFLLLKSKVLLQFVIWGFIVWARRLRREVLFEINAQKLICLRENSYHLSWRRFFL